MITIASAGSHHDWRQFVIWLVTLAVAAISMDLIIKAGNRRPHKLGRVSKIRDDKY